MFTINSIAKQSRLYHNKHIIRIFSEKIHFEKGMFVNRSIEFFHKMTFSEIKHKLWDQGNIFRSVKGLNFVDAIVCKITHEFNQNRVKPIN